MNIKSTMSRHCYRALALVILLCSVGINAESNTESTTMYYSIALEPDVASYEQAAALRQRYDPVRAAYMKPHVTLKQPFQLHPNATEVELISAIERAISELPALELEHQGVHFFYSKHYQHVVHWKLENSDKFKHLTQVVALACSNFNADLAKYPVEREVNNTFPHLTLAQQVSAEIAQQALGDPYSQPLQKNIISKRIIIAKSTDFQHWKVIRKINFSENNSVATLE